MASHTPNLGLTIPVGPEHVSRQIVNENNTKIDTAVGNLNSNKANYLLIDATSYTHNSKAGWDFVYGQIPNEYNGILRINFSSGYNIICTAYRQNSNWGSIIGHENSDHIPFFYNVQNGTSTLDELALNSKIDSQKIIGNIGNGASKSFDFDWRNSLAVIFIGRGSGNRAGLYYVDGDGGVITVSACADVTVTYSNNAFTISNSGATVYYRIINY